MFWAYLGAILLTASFSPSLDVFFDKYRILHALWHVTLFLGAALLVFGLESLRNISRRYRRMAN